MAGKAALNPDATPHVPRSSILAGGSREEEKSLRRTLKDSEEQTAVSQAPITGPVHNIHRTDYAGTTEKSGSEMAQHVGAPSVETLPDESVETETHAVMDDHAATVDFLCSMFPHLCKGQVADVLHWHGGNVAETIDILEGFKDFPELSEAEFKLLFPELSEAEFNLLFPSPEGSYCDESSPSKKS